LANPQMTSLWCLLLRIHGVNRRRK
jgi:hypothetical protein